jgi:retinol-binding protein 3
MRERMRRFMGSMNYGFRKLERLEGNVGYLELEGFFPTELGAETAVAAMNFLANTDALIIDLRHNHGGGPAMVALICSYLFDPEPVHLNDLYFRPEDSTHQWWTLAYVPGKRYTGKDVYVLTSKETVSAAEEFTYNLKTRKRATIVGETTAGGANPGGPRRINDNFAIWVPSGRAINPVTKTNWEGTGVAPDVAVSSARALQTAHLAALKTIAEKAAARRRASSPAPEPGEERRDRELRKAIERLQKELGTGNGTHSAGAAPAW